MVNFSYRERGGKILGIHGLFHEVGVRCIISYFYLSFIFFSLVVYIISSRVKIGLLTVSHF
jgi:hypothetical protein